MFDVYKDVAAKSIGKYGVGSCGPRGFYGTVGMSFDSYFYSLIILS